MEYLLAGGETLTLHCGGWLSICHDRFFERGIRVLDLRSETPDMDFLVPGFVHLILRVEGGLSTGENAGIEMMRMLA